MDQYGWIWQGTNAKPEIGYVDLALPVELIWFEDYLALAETLNFSKAAELRHVTQPAFSRRIRALEGWVGAALFTRTTHGVALTPAGEHFHSQAEVLTRALHQLRRDTSEVSGRGGRPLSIAATHALSFTFFPKWVRGNERVLALGNLSLISDSMQACEQMMLRGDAQFLLCHHHKDASSRIYSTQWGAKNRAFALEAVFTSHLAATLLSMARAGDGVAWLPRTLAEEDISTGLLVEAGSPELEIPIEIRLFRPVARQSKAVEAIWSAFERS